MATLSDRPLMRGFLAIINSRHSIGLSGILLAGFICGNARAEEPAVEIRVEVASGRMFAGAIDAQTDRNDLWLRVVSGPITLRRPIEWDCVAHAWRDGKELSLDELRAAAERWKSAQPKAGSLKPTEHPAPPPPQPAADVWQSVPQPAVAPRTASVVTSLQLDVELGHWTPGVESSGLVVHAWPLDADGRLTPVDGTLEVNLIGVQLGGEATAQSPVNAFGNLGRWSQTVHAADFASSGATYRLPFQAQHPDFDTDIQPHALVHARLTVPGQGTFEASCAMVRIRTYSSVRDRLQEANGDRFFPVER